MNECLCRHPHNERFATASIAYMWVRSRIAEFYFRWCANFVPFTNIVILVKNTKARGASTRIWPQPKSEREVKTDCNRVICVRWFCHRARCGTPTNRDRSANRFCLFSIFFFFRFFFILLCCHLLGKWGELKIFSVRHIITRARTDRINKCFAAISETNV